MYDVIIPVYRPDFRLKRIIKALEGQTLKPARIILIESRDGIFKKSFGREKSDFSSGSESETEIVRLWIKAGDFDHAATRNMGVQYSKEPYFVFLTQDAVPLCSRTMERLLQPLLEGKAPLSYGRQMADEGAGPRERLTRAFNYPEKSMLKSSGDIKRLGIKTYFCSNACAAYNRSVFDALGGFYAPAIFNEDMVYAHRVIESGYNIAYAAGARVSHSHDYTVIKDFSRSFDLGVSQAMHPEVFAGVRSESEGVRYVLRLCRELFGQREYGEIPLMIIHSGARFAGYRLGRGYRKLPVALARMFSMNKNFWKVRY